MKLMLAFICKHGLTTITSDKCDNKENNMSNEEVKQVVLMMSGMEKGSFSTTRKMIERGKK